MFRNSEIGRFAVVFAVLTAAAVTAGYMIGEKAAIVTIIYAAAIGTAFFVFTKSRYNALAELSEQIDRVLHNAEHVYISESKEGELAILQSEITKMTVRIRQQNDALKKEKQHLADSLADIAHQLRTPLTSVNLILSILESEDDLKKRISLLREAEELMVQMEWLLDALLKLSRLDAGIAIFQSGPVDVKNLVDTALRPFAISMELHDISVDINVPGGVSVNGDAGWLSEALQNILKNCMESAGDGGRLDIYCEDTALYTQITVHDSGPGFDEEDLPRIFDRFYRGKGDSACGYGIGLALCRTIINRHGATVKAGNHRNGGALFIIRFPK